MKNGFLGLFKNEKPILAMLHLKGENDADIEERMKKEIDLYVENGVDCIIVENYFRQNITIWKKLWNISRACIWIFLTVSIA